jgi:hypothetical protein
MFEESIHRRGTEYAEIFLFRTLPLCDLCRLCGAIAGI